MAFIMVALYRWIRTVLNGCSFHGLCTFWGLVTKWHRALREYPVPFAWKVVDLYPDLVQAARGTARLPDAIPPSMVSFEAMRRGTKQVCGLEWANLEDVYSYLRNGKHLVIPKHWRKHLPKEPPQYR